MSNAFPMRVPKYRRHKAKGLAVVTINGRDRYLGKYGSAASKSEYKRLVAEYLQNGGSQPCKAETTIAEVMAAFLRHAKNYYRKHGKPTREYGHIVEVCGFIKPLYSRSLATDFGPQALEVVRQSMIEAGYSRGFINKQVDRIKRMFRWAASKELIPSAIPQALSMVTGLRRGRTEAHETAPVVPVEDESIEATLEQLPPIVADMVRLQRLTGMRPEEVCMLKPADIDRNDSIWTYRPGSHKTEHQGRERVVLLGPKSQEILLRYLARDATTNCFRPCDSEAKRRAARQAARKTPATCGNRVGTNRVKQPKRKAGQSYSTPSYRRAIHRACDRAVIDRWSPNRLRHSAATEIRREFGLEAAQVILGHSAADVTQVYAERDLAKGLEVARQIG
jgi:integrase